MRLANDPPTDRLLLDEAAARRLLLVQAIDTVDAQGRLVGPSERERIEHEALSATGDPARGQTLDAQAWLLLRADRLLDLVRHRQRGLAALAQAPAWQHWAAWGLPLLALVLGGTIDRIDNPKQVNLLSPPLLAFLLWNLGVYVAVLVMALWPRRRRAADSERSPLRDLLAWRTGGLRGDVAKAFALAWWTAAGALEGQRWRRILHTSAAAWAVGVALSIVAGGLVREYRVGWESTLLDLPQVHALLRALFAPVVALLPIEPFSQAELARLHFGSGVEVGRLEARRWVGLYVSLLVVLVVLPRSVLAAWAALRQHRLARAIAIDLRSPYFVALLGRVSPARVRIGIAVLGDADPAPLHLVLRQAAAVATASARREHWTVLDTPRGDALRCEAFPLAAPNAPRAPWAWLRVQDAAGQPPAPDILLLVGSPDAFAHATAQVQQLGCAVLLLPVSGSAGAAAATLRAAGLNAEALPLTELPTWHEDDRLQAALGRLLPAHMAPGWERLVGAWREHALARLGRSMHALAEELLAAARDAEPLPVAPLGVRQLVVRSEREAGAEARRVAVTALSARARERQHDTDRQLASLHGIEHVAQPAADRQLPGAPRVHHAVDEPQAGLAGVASGAAMGAAVDLMTGGLTLGAASALGALVGGGAALAAAAWKNRAAQPGVSLVVLEENVLQGLAELALLRYLRIAHAGRAGVAGDTAGEAAVRSELEPQRAALREAWRDARAAKDGAALAARVAGVLQQATLRLLTRLHRGSA
ncbi:MAG: DUF3482 domain-containing protein [Ramlibacter sp.]